MKRRGASSAMSRWQPPFWYGGHEFNAEDLALVLGTVRRFRDLSFGELVATICEILPWKAPNGQLKVIACREFLQQLAAAGLVELPARSAGRTGAKAERRGTEPPSPVVRATLREIGPVRVEPVETEDGPTWNAMMAVYHPLGYRRVFGAQQKYWIRYTVDGETRVLGGLVFGAAAKALAARDAWIGWDPDQRRRYRHRIVSNNRYLLLPTVQVPHLASHALALALRRLPGDWVTRYGYRPVLVETFVEPPWAGTCYRAANWQLLGETAGRGRQDRERANAETVKTIWVYPLCQNWRTLLMAPLEVAPEDDGDF